MLCEGCFGSFFIFICLFCHCFWGVICFFVVVVLVGLFVGVLGGFGWVLLGWGVFGSIFLGGGLFSQFDFSVVVQCQTPGPSGR